MIREASGSVVEELGGVVRAAQGGDLDAFGVLVRRFQDMAYASAYALIGDAHLAEDATQEAFLQAYFDLPMLHEPAAFPGWFRRIVFKHSDRLTRGKRAVVIPLDEAAIVPDPEPGPSIVAERREMRAVVRAEIDRLPAHERVAVTLFYSGHSQDEIAAFLGVPVGTVKKRLHDARKRLMEQMLAAMHDTFREGQLALGDRFVRKVEFLIGVSTGDIGRVERLLARAPSLATITLTMDDWRQAGAVHQQSLPMRWGYTPLHLAATYGYTALVDILLAHGANPDAASCGETPLHRAVMVDDDAMVTTLLRCGAAVNIVDANGMTALHRAVINRRDGIVETLLARGALVATRDKAGRTPTMWAVLKGDSPLVERLRARADRGDSGDGLTRPTIATPVGEGALGRVLDDHGAPIDGHGPLRRGARGARPSRHDRTASPARDETARDMLTTGIKVIDLLAPLRRGGTTCLSGATGVGVMATLGEWTHGLWTRGRGCAVFLDWPARPVQVDDLVREWREQGIERGVALVLGRMTDTRAQRRRAVLAALAVAERLRDEGRDVLLAVAATDVEWHILSRLRDRLPCVAVEGSITLVVLDIWWDGVPTPLFGIHAWDSWVVLDAARARDGFHPAVDPLTSGSHLLEGPPLDGEHTRIADHARALLRRYPDIHSAACGSGADALCPTDHRHAARARRLQRFLTQSLHVREAVTGRPGEYVALGDTLAGVAALLKGCYDDRPEDSFVNIGAIDPTPALATSGRT